MSMLIGAAASVALSGLQALMQQGSAKEVKKPDAADPLSMLMQAISDDGADKAQASTAAPPTKPASGASAPQFRSDTMSALLAAQEAA